ncbi:MAG: hypothetical protein ACTSXA_11940 [Candidatus Heimdallarchaeota archaeon]
MTAKDYIPLFLRIKYGELGAIIIDDQVVVCVENQSTQHHYYKPYMMLHQLYANSSIRQSFPKQLREFFDDEEAKLLFEKIPEDCLIGELGDLLYHCLKANITIKENSSSPVRIYDFGYGHFRFDFIPLNYNVKLTAAEAFHLFANLCASSIPDLYGSFLKENQIVSFDKEILLKKTKERYEHKKNPKFGIRWALLAYKIEQFAITYLDYLLNRINKKELTPETILHWNGATILALFIENPIVRSFAKDCLEKILKEHEKLTTNQKIIYITFLAEIGNSQFPKYVFPFTDAIWETFRKITTSLVKSSSIDSFK